MVIVDGWELWVYPCHRFEPQNRLLDHTCEARKDLNPCASAFTSNPTYKQYIDIVIHLYTHTYMYSHFSKLIFLSGMERGGEGCGGVWRGGGSNVLSCWSIWVGLIALINHASHFFNNYDNNNNNNNNNKNKIIG